MVLPDPFGPRNPKTEPTGTCRSMPSTAGTLPNCLLRPVVSMSGGGPSASRCWGVRLHVGAVRAQPRRRFQGGGADRTDRDPTVVHHQDVDQGGLQHPSLAGRPADRRGGLEELVQLPGHLDSLEDRHRRPVLADRHRLVPLGLRVRLGLGARGDRRFGRIVRAAERLVGDRRPGRGREREPRRCRGRIFQGAEPDAQRRRLLALGEHLHLQGQASDTVNRDHDVVDRRRAGVGARTSWYGLLAGEGDRCGHRHCGRRVDVGRGTRPPAAVGS